MKYLDGIDRLLLTKVQEGVPLVEKPFAEIGRQLAITEEEVVERVGRLKAKGYIRRFGGIFDTPSLGFAGTLVAMAVPPERLDEVGEIVSRSPAVTHNYARDHERYNLWFTLICRDRPALEEELERLVEETGVEDYLELPTVRFFKIGATFDLSQGGEPDGSQG